MEKKITTRKQSITGYCGRWMLFVILLSPPLQAQEPESLETIEAAWQPKVYKFSRYQKMLSKAPFGKVPLNAPPPAVVEEAPPPEEKQLAIAAVSVVEGKPVVYLIDLKTRAYQKINTEKDNESKIRLIEISEESNPREVVAKVTINGRVTTVKYDTGLLDSKPKLASKRKGRANTVAANRIAQSRVQQPINTVTKSPALVQNTNRAQSNLHPRNLQTGGKNVPANRVAPAAGGQVPVIRSIQDQRRLSTVPRRRVIVPGQSSVQQTTPGQ
ncbi:MAG: hypothetical protein GXP30_08075 [Verrucomicrobia bacterium]|nr:hypothetical protein [Verrucomicrobiota bacterium]